MRESVYSCFIFFNDTATTEIYTLSLHDALPILDAEHPGDRYGAGHSAGDAGEAVHAVRPGERLRGAHARRSEEHTSELQSRQYLVCRLLLEKKKYHPSHHHFYSRDNKLHVFDSK